MGVHNPRRGLSVPARGSPRNMRVAKMPYLQLSMAFSGCGSSSRPSFSRICRHLIPARRASPKLLRQGIRRKPTGWRCAWIADFQAILNKAEAALRGEDGWKRYTYYPGPYEGSFGGPRIVRCHELPPDHQINPYGEAIVLGDGHPLKPKTVGAPVSFESMIDKWAKFTNAPKKGIQDKITKCGEFTAWLRTEQPSSGR